MSTIVLFSSFFFFTDTATTEIYTLSLHDALPIFQNVGAYGQEVAETLVALRALDTRSGRVVRLTHTDCRFAYRDSLFKSGEPGRFLVLDLPYRLRRGGEPTLRYAEVAQHLGPRGLRRPSLAELTAR